VKNQKKSLLNELLDHNILIVKSECAVSFLSLDNHFMSILEVRNKLFKGARFVKGVMLPVSLRALIIFVEQRPAQPNRLLWSAPHVLVIRARTAFGFTPFPRSILARIFNLLASKPRRENRNHLFLPGRSAMQVPMMKPKQS